MNFSKKNHEYKKTNKLFVSKKLTILFVLLAFITNVNAQWFGKKIKGNGNVVTETRNVSDYDAIGVAGSFDVKLVAGKEGKLTVKIEENLSEYLITEVEDGKLKIKWKKGVSINTTKGLLVTVPFEDIEAVSLAGSGDVFSDDVIKTDHLKVALSGSGDIKLNVNTDNISSAVSGSGDVVLAGKTQKLKCSLAGSGDINGYELVSKDAEVSIAGSGDIKVNVTDNLKARVAGSGDIYYKGNPRQDVKVSGSGSVSSR